MTEFAASAIEAAIQNLQARRPKPRGRRQELAPYVDELRKLIASGWSRSEIVNEVKALGGKMSPALLRDVLQITPAEPEAKQKKLPRKKPPEPKVPSPPAPVTLTDTAPPPPETDPASNADTE